MAEELQQRRRLAAIMFTDMVGYSALSQENEGLALELLNEHRGLLREVLALHGGREIEAIGDGFFVEFPSALAGANCAVEIQRVLHDRNASASPERRIQVRIGLHLGDVVAQDDRVHGDGVNIAARIEPLAEPGGICLSEDVARQIQNKIDLPLQRLGKADLKNIRTPVQIYRLVLPWERKYLLGSERLAFSVRQRQTRRTIISAGGLLMLGGLASAWVWRQRQVTPVNNRIAVLPFVSMSASAADDYFVDGMTEELISRLSRIKGLEVIARTSIVSYKGTKKRIGEIAGELNAGTVLEGSARVAGGKVRITAQLINATNDAHLWSEDYDREFKDIFTVQTDIAQHVANALAARLHLVSVVTSPETHAQEPKGKVTKDLDAYNAYLQGRFYYSKGTAEDLHKAIEYFEEAVRRDPSYALAFASIADAYEQLIGYEGASAEKYSRARSAGLKALELDDSMAEAHTTLAVVKTFYDWDWAGADAAFQRALSLDPNSATTHNWYGWYLLFLRRWDDGLSELHRAVELDPVAINEQADLASGFQAAGRWDEAIKQVQSTLKLAPGHGYLLDTLGWAYLGKRMYKEALATFQMEFKAGADREEWALCGVASAYAFLNDMEQALEVRRRLQERSENVPGHAFAVALVNWALASRDERYRDDTYRWLNKTYQEHGFELVYSSSRWWDGWRSDPRWIAFRKKMGLPP